MIMKPALCYFDREIVAASARSKMDTPTQRNVAYNKVEESMQQLSKSFETSLTVQNSQVWQKLFSSAG